MEIGKAPLTRRQVIALLSAAMGAHSASAAGLGGRLEASSEVRADGALAATTGSGASKSRRLADVDPELEQMLKYGDMPPLIFSAAEIKCQTVRVTMRDGVRLATDLYLPPKLPAPVIALRTPYARDRETQVGAMIALARRGYVFVSQDCRGTGGSEPDSWDYYVFEAEDGYDCVEWISKQSWYGGFIGSCGGSYVGQTQWPMATHAAMSTIIPSVSGLGFGFNTARKYMFLNAYAQAVGKGEGRAAIPIHKMERVFEKETMEGGYFNEPLHKPFSKALLARYPKLSKMRPAQAQRWLWQQFSGMTCAQRAEFIKQALGVKNVNSVNASLLPALFGQNISQDAQTIPHASPAGLCKLMKAPPLMYTGWYDWCLNDAFATWQMLRREASPEVAERARLLVTPFAHNMPGYHVAGDEHPDLLRLPNMLDQVGWMTRWYDAIQKGKTDQWPRVTYYLMGANEWRVAEDWPVPGATEMKFYIGAGGALSTQAPTGSSAPDRYTYDPANPTPTVGGSIVSYIYRPGSANVGEVQQRSDVLVYTSEPLKEELDVVGPLRMILYASSSAVDTDFAVRLSDVFPDGRAIQLQHCLLRARYRDAQNPQLLEPGRVYRFEIDLWATANRFKAGHRLRVDVSSADFPKFDRNSNRAGQGDPVPARQTIYHDAERPSHLVCSVITVP